MVDEVIESQGEILEVLKYGNILEFKMGAVGTSVKYIQRLGSPGHYIYIYPTNSMAKLSRKARFTYSRMVSRASRFLKRVQRAYSAESMSMKPKNWHTSIVTMTGKQIGMTQFTFDLKTHGIYSYRSKRGHVGASVKLAKAKKKGILRYR